MKLLCVTVIFVQRLILGFRVLDLGFCCKVLPETKLP